MADSFCESCGNRIWDKNTGYECQESNLICEGCELELLRSDVATHSDAQTELAVLREALAEAERGLNVYATKVSWSADPPNVMRSLTLPDESEIFDRWERVGDGFQLARNTLKRIELIKRGHKTSSTLPESRGEESH